MPRSRLTARKRARFLDVLSQCGNVAEAARQSGLSRQYAYVLREQDPDFAEAWDGALDEAVDALELEARRRAVEGVEQPVFHAGKLIGTRRVYSDRLLIFLLQAHRPERFGTGRRREAENARKTAPQAAPEPPAETPPAEPRQILAGPVIEVECGGERVVYDKLYAEDEETGEMTVVGTYALAPRRLKDLWESTAQEMIEGWKHNRILYAGSPPESLP